MEKSAYSCSILRRSKRKLREDENENVVCCKKLTSPSSMSITRSPNMSLLNCSRRESNYLQEIPVQPNSQEDLHARSFNESDSSALSEEFDVDVFAEEDETFLLNIPVPETFYGLPLDVKMILSKHRGINQLYSWQDDLMKKLITSDRNVIYCVPTSGGKTLVAELMMLKEMLVCKRSCIMVLPYISIVQEKVRAMQVFARKLGFLIEEYAGAKGRVPPAKHCRFRTLYVATFEKCHVLVTSLYEQKRLPEIGLMVFDEMHMIGDGTTRGATLEGLIVKTKLAAQKSRSQLRFIGMSATLNNISDMEKFLNAEAIKNEFRPVQLKEYVKMGPVLVEVPSKPPVVLEDNTNVIKTFSQVLIKEDPDHLKDLVGEVVPKGSCLVFCPTKDRCQHVALNLTRLLPSSLQTIKKEEKLKLYRDIRESNDGYICPFLKNSIPSGIAYHHSGLTAEERALIEAAFLEGTLCCIVCTSTLAAGVNLPAQRVIIRAPYVGCKFLEKTQYKQMCGRAGRAGFSSQYGESILICDEKDHDRVKRLLETPLESCTSSLAATEDSLAVFLLNLVHLELVSDCQGLENILRHQTLYGIQLVQTENIANIVQSCITMLVDQHLLIVDGKSLKIKPLGRAVVKSLISLPKCKPIMEHLSRAQQNLNLTNYMHLTFLATLLIDDDDIPIPTASSNASTRHSELYSNAYFRLNEVEQKSAEVIGVKMGDVYSVQRSGNMNPKHKRFYMSMMVYDIWKTHADLGTVASRYFMQRGALQNLLYSIANHATALLRFVEEIPNLFWAFKSLLPELCTSLSYCCVPEIIPLMELPAVKVARAKQLYQAGFRDVKSIAKVRDNDLVDKVNNLTRKQAKNIIKAARHLLRGQADELEENAHDLLEVTEKTQTN
ncbi:Helicase POLQ-like [Halotydeus destructor]|nr:Helicase POLQ-like [Halotydeus destructor]